MLEEVFERARAEGRAAFIPYIVAGDPDLATTAMLLHALTDAGVDAIELGIPYGDPLADGPSIAAAATRAVARGTTMERVFDVAARYRETRSDTVPIIAFTYFNPVYRYGMERFARSAASAGISAAIVPDISLEEGGGLRSALAASGLQMPLLVAPSTSMERARRIAERSSGFIYVVSRTGVTGAGTTPDFAPLRALLGELRLITAKPLAVGFGVSLPEHVRAVAPLADGIIVGSALLDAYAEKAGADAAVAASGFVRPLLQAARGG